MTARLALAGVLATIGLLQLFVGDKGSAALFFAGAIAAFIQGRWRAAEASGEVPGRFGTRPSRAGAVAWMTIGVACGAVACWLYARGIEPGDARTGLLATFGIVGAIAGFFVGIANIVLMK